MDPMPFKICPSCGAEFQAWATQCSDCECDLVHPESLATEAEGAVDVADPSPAQLTCLARGGPWELRELAEALQEHGVACRIGPYPPRRAPSGGESRQDEGPAGFGLDLGIYVEERDLERAAQLHQQFIRAWSHVEAGAAAAPGDAEACPACGAALDADADACGSCGLEFPPLEG